MPIKWDHVFPIFRGNNKTCSKHLQTLKLPPKITQELYAQKKPLSRSQNECQWRASSLIPPINYSLLFYATSHTIHETGKFIYYIHLGLIFYGFHVGIIYNRPMDPMGSCICSLGAPNSKSASTKVSTSGGWPNGLGVAETMGCLVKIHETYCWWQSEIR